MYLSWASIILADETRVIDGNQRRAVYYPQTYYDIKSRYRWTRNRHFLHVKMYIQLPYDRHNDSSFWDLIRLLENTQESEKHYHSIGADTNNTKLQYNTLLIPNLFCTREIISTTFCDTNVLCNVSFRYLTDNCALWYLV